MNFGGWVLIWHSYWPSSLLLTRLIRRRQLSGYWNSIVYRESPVYVCWPTVSRLIFSLLSCRRNQDTCEYKAIFLKKKEAIYSSLEDPFLRREYWFSRVFACFGMLVIIIINILISFPCVSGFKKQICVFFQLRYVQASRSCMKVSCMQ